MRPVHVMLAVLVAALWGFNFVVIRIGIDNFPPLLFSAFRFSLAALPLVFFIRKPDVPWRIIIAIGLVLGEEFGLIRLLATAMVVTGLILTVAVKPKQSPAA